MNIQIKTLVLACSGSLLAGTVLSRYTEMAPYTKLVMQNHVITKIKEVVKTDGSREIDTVITDTSKKQVTEAKFPPRPDWRISGGYGLNITQYSLSVDRRILGPVWIGLQGRTDGTILGQVGIEF